MTKFITPAKFSSCLIADDKNGNLWKSNPDKCCRIRKVLPLEEKLQNFDAWVSGRKAYQKGEREFLKIFEIQNEKIIVNPLINYNFENISDYFRRNKLPRHPLFFKNTYHLPFDLGWTTKWTN